jgi:hypothetical protein
VAPNAARKPREELIASFACFLTLREALLLQRRMLLPGDHTQITPRSPPNLRKGPRVTLRRRLVVPLIRYWHASLDPSKKNNPQDVATAYANRRGRGQLTKMQRITENN